MKIHLFAALLLVGCGSKPEPVDSATPSPAIQLDRAYTPLAADDPLRLYFFQQTVDEMPLVYDAAGERVPLVPHVWGDRQQGWVPEQGWLPGAYTLDGVEGRNEVGAQAQWQVGTWGTATVDAPIGTAWRLERLPDAPNPDWDAAGLVGLASSVGTIEVHLEEETADGLVFSVYADTEYGTCLVLRDVGAWDGSALSWGADEWTLQSNDRDIEAWNLGLDLHFDDSDVAAGQFRVEVDAKHLQKAIFIDPDPNEICSWGESFGAPCHACPTDRDCTGTEAYNQRFVRVDDPVDTTLVCGVDLQVQAPGPLEIEISPISCDLEIEPIECGCSTDRGLSLGWPIWFMALVVLRRRRLGR